MALTDGEFKMTILTSELGSGGGGGVPVGTVLPINSSDDVYVAPDGSTWLQSGTFETTAGTYPDAEYGYTGEIDTYSGVSFDTSAQDSGMIGITWDGTHFWAVGRNTDRVYKYTAAGVYTGVNFSVASENTGPYSITWDGSSLRVLGDNNRLYRYYTSGAYANDFINITVTSGLNSIVWDGTHFWASNQSGVYQFNLDGTYTGFDFPITTIGGTYFGIEWDGSHLLAVSLDDDSIHKYSRNGAYVGSSFSVASQDTVPRGMAFDGSDIWVLGENTDTVYKYTTLKGYGIPEATDTDSGLPLYVKVA